MKWFRNSLRENRAFILTLLAVCLYSMAGGPDYAHAYQVHQQKEERLAEIAKILDIPIDELRPDHVSLWETVGDLLGIEPEDPVKKAGQERLKEVLRKHEEQIAANPYRDEIEAVKAEHAIHRIAGALDDVLELTDPPGRKALRPLAKQAMLRNLDVALEEGFTLPPLRDGLPAKAERKHAEMQRRLDDVARTLRPIVAEAVAEKADPERGPNPEKIVRMKRAMDGVLARPERAPRFADRPLPLQRVEKTARVEEVDAATLDLHPTAALVRASASAPAAPSPAAKSAIAPEVAALAAELGNSPARIFRYVHDTIDYDPKWGAVTGPLGTLWEKRGTSWDQAWLLRDLLVAAGVDARFEWGEVQVPVDVITNLTGLDDPFRAGDLLTTAGIPIVLLVDGSRVVAARMSHVWVKVWVDYVPNRGVTPGAGDTWIRMDPSFKRYDYAPGIPVHEDVPFSLGGYLLSGTELSPRRSYEEALWSYIRDQGIVCTTLEQLKQAPSLVAEAFPYLPGTLRASVVSLAGEDAAVPAAFQHQLTVDVRRAGAGSLLAWSSPLPALYGRRLGIDFQGATPDDQATLDSHGGVFQTPPYLVDLQPRLTLDGAPAAAAGVVGGAEDTEIFVTLTPPASPATTLVHDGFAGEESVLVTDFGRLPQRLVDVPQAAYAANGGDADRLHLVGTTYLRNLARDLGDLNAWTWHRWVQLGTEGLVTRTGQVTTTAGGSPLTFTEGPTFIDIASMPLGMFHTSGTRDQLVPAFELAGAQGSYLEGSVFPETTHRDGIAAVSSLTHVVRSGSRVHRVDAGNLDAFLAAAQLEPEVEAEIAVAIHQGKIAWAAEEVTVIDAWTGTGYVLENPETGAAGYLLSGAYAGGASTGDRDGGDIVLGSEEWLEVSPLASMLRLLFQVLLYTATETLPRGPAPGTTYGDPINLATGNLWLQEPDVMLQARGVPILLLRTYNSQSDFSGPFGLGWTFNYGEHLVIQADGDILFRQHDGTEHLFEQDGDAYRSPAGVHFVLESLSEGYALRTRDGYASTFDRDGLLLSLADPNGNTVRLVYDIDGNLSQIEDAAGRVALQFTYADGRIARVADVGLREWHYEYSGDRLVSVRDSESLLLSYAYDGEGRLASRSDAAGALDSYQYDAQGRCYRHVDPLGNAESFSYGAASTIVTDRRGHESYYTFRDDLAVARVDPVGNVTRSAWDEKRNRISVIDSQGGQTSYEYDDVGNQIARVDPLGNRWEATYGGPTNNELERVDPLGTRETFTYDAAGNMLSRTVSTGTEVVTETWEYDEHGQMVAHHDVRGNTTGFGWDPLTGQISERTDALGNTTTYETDGLGRIARVVDPLGGTVELEWSTRDEILAASTENSRVEHEYDMVGRRTRVMAPTGTIEMEYDALGRLVRERDAVGSDVRREYDAAGNVVAIQDPRGNETRFVLDPLGRTAAVVDPSGGVWSMTFCAALASACASCSQSDGDREAFCELRSPEGEILRQELDLLGRVVAVIDPQGNRREQSYDALGRQTGVTDPLGRTTSLAYDALGRLSEVTDAAGATTQYSYDAAGNRIRTRFANGTETAARFDELNRQIEAVDAAGNVTSFSYDASGQLTVVALPDGSEVTRTYEGRNLTRILLPDGSEESFTYDVEGRLIAAVNPEAELSYVYDGKNRLAEVTRVDLGQTVSYDYDENGNLTRADSAAGSVEYLYDEKDRLVEVVDEVTGTFRLTYDASDRRRALTFPNGVVTAYQYDAAGQLASLVTKDASGRVLDGYGYDHDAAGQITAAVALRDGLVSSYEYDVVGRLQRWKREGSLFEEFEYDSVGNRIRKVSPQGVVDYTYDPRNALLTEVFDHAGGGSTETVYEHDVNGNLVSKITGATLTRFEYDGLGRLTSIDSPNGLTSFGYAPDGTRSRETTGSSTQRYLNSLQNVMAVFDGAGSLTSRYTQLPWLDRPLAQVEGGAVSYLHLDALGSVTALSRPDGLLGGTRIYRPFGEVLEENGDSSRFGFTGRESHGSGLMYFRNRYYDPTVGRFTSPDPFSGDATSPGSLHRFAYVMNNPVSYVDPLGLYCARPSEKRWGIGSNRASPGSPWPDPIRPGACFYLGERALNIYLDPVGERYFVDGRDGHLLPMHINAKWLQWVQGRHQDRGYGNRKPLNNWHIGFWYDSREFCFIVHDSRTQRTAFKLCIRLRTLQIIFSIILFIALLAIIYLLIASMPVWVPVAAGAAAAIFLILAIPRGDPGGGGTAA